MTIVSMIDTSTITERLRLQLFQWPALADTGARVESNEPINEDTNRCPWIGLYQVRQSFPLRTLGVSTGFRRHNITLAIVLTASSIVSGRDCELRMEALVKGVMDALLSDVSIGGTVDVIDDQIDITYSQYRQVNNIFFKEAVIQFTAVTQVTVNLSGG